MVQAVVMHVSCGPVEHLYICRLPRFKVLSVLPGAADDVRLCDDLFAVQFDGRGYAHLRLGCPKYRRLGLVHVTARTASGARRGCHLRVRHLASSLESELLRLLTGLRITAASETAPLEPSNRIRA